MVVSTVGAVMGRLTMTLDEKLLEEAGRALGTRTKRDTVLLALQEVVRRSRQRGILEHMGKLDLGFTVEELIRWREQT